MEEQGISSKFLKQYSTMDNLDLTILINDSTNIVVTPDIVSDITSDITCAFENEWVYICSVQEIIISKNKPTSEHITIDILCPIFYGAVYKLERQKGATFSVLMVAQNKNGESAYKEILLGKVVEYMEDERHNDTISTIRYRYVLKNAQISNWKPINKEKDKIA